MAGREYVSKFQLVVDPEEQRRRDAIAQGIVQDELTTAIDAGDARSASHLQQELKNRFSGKTGVAPTFTETPAFASETSAPSSTPDGWTVIDPGWTRKKPQAATPSGWEDVSSQFYYAGAQPKEQQPDDSFTGSMARGIKKTIPELKQAGAGAIAYLGDVFGAEGVKEWGLNKYHEIEDSTKNLQSANDSFSKVVLDGEGSFKAWLGNAVGYSIGQVGLALVSGGVGAIGGKMIAKQGLTKLVEGEIAKSFEKNVAAGMAEEAAKAAAIKTGQEFAAGALVAGRNTGAFTGALLHNETQELGSIYNDAVEQAKKEGRTLDGGDLFRIGASSLAAAGVDTAMEAVNFNKLTKGGIGSTLAKRAAVEIPSGMAREGVTESVQTGIEQYGAGKPLDTREIIDSAALGAVGGGMAGGGAALRQRQAPTASDAQTIEQAATLPVTPVVSPEDVLAIQPQSLPIPLSPREQRQQAVADKLYPLPTQRETAPTADRQLEAINAINPLPEQRDGTIGVRQTPFTDAEIAAGVQAAQDSAPRRLPSPDMPANNGVMVQDATGVRPQTFGEVTAAEQARLQADQVAAERAKLGIGNVQRVDAQALAQIARPEPATPAATPDAQQVTLRSDGKPFETLKAAETSIKARGLSGAVAVSVKGGGFGIRMAAPATQAIAPAPAIQQVAPTPPSPAPAQDTSLKATATLAQAIRKFGGLPEKFARDLTGEPALTANKLPGYRGLFHASGTDLSTLVHDGKLDAYLPPNLRSDVRDDSRPTDTDAAVAHIEAILRNGEAQTAKSYARTEAKQQRLTAAAQKQQVVAPIEKGDTQASADAISEAEYEHYKQTGEPGFGWMPGAESFADSLDANTLEQLDALLNLPESTDERAAMRSMGFTEDEITETLGPDAAASAGTNQVPESAPAASESAPASREAAPPAAEVTAHQSAIDADNEMRALDKKGVVVENAEDYFALANKAEDARQAFAREIIESSDIGLSAKTSDGRQLVLNESAQQPGKWQMTRFARDGSPWGDTQFPSKAQAVNEFLREAEISTVERISGNNQPASVSPNEAAAKALESAAVAIRAMAAPQAAAKATDEAKADDMRGRAWALVKNGNVVRSGSLPAPQYSPEGPDTKASYYRDMADQQGADLYIGGYPASDASPLPGTIFGMSWEQLNAKQQRSSNRADLPKGKMPSNAVLAYSPSDPQARPALDLTNPTESKLRTDDAKQKRDAAEKAAKENAPSPEEFGLVGSNRAADVGAAAGQNALFQNTASYGNNAANENEAYATDLFGDPVPSAARAPRADSAKRPALRRDAQPKPALRDTERPDGEYLASTIVGASGERELGVSRILTAEHAAAATRYLYRSAVERFDAIVTDKNGKPLAVVGGFKGAPTQTAVYPSVVIAEAMRVPGAANIWLSHNHPSGSETLSNADIRLESTFSDALRGSGIQHMGLLAVAGDRRYSHVYDGNITKGESRGPGSATISVPVIERELADNRIDKVSVNAPDIAKQVARDFYEKSNGPGVILLDAQHKLLGWMTITPNMYGALRGKSGGLNAIYRALSHSGAVSGIIAHGGELDARIGDIERVTASQNIAAALSKVDVSPLDSINVKTGKSVAMIGDRVADGPLFSRADTIEVDGQQRPRNNSNGKPIAATDEGIRNFWRWFAGSRVVDERGRPLVVYHGTGADIEVFDNAKGPERKNTKGVSWFSSSPNVANDFAGEQTGERIAGVTLGYSNVLPVYLKIENPVPERSARSLAIGGGLDRAEAKSWADEGYDGIAWLNSDFDLPDNDPRGYSREFDGSVYGEDVPYPNQYAIFSPAQAKSALGNTGQFSPDNADIRFSREAPLWRSTLTEAIGKTSFAQAPADQWKTWLNANAAKLGVKKDEIEWSGVTDWLALQKGKVTRDQVREFLDANGVKVAETMLGGDTEGVAMKAAITEANNALVDHLVTNESFDRRGANDYALDAARGELTESQKRYMSADTKALVDELRDAYFARTRDPQAPTKYGQYQLPGGESYRELLLTLPTRDQAATEADAETRRIREEGGRAYRGETNKSDFKSSHWDQPNILAHIRFNERTDADGKRVLFIEEIQSDWGQEGKKKGFARSKEAIQIEFDKVRQRYLDTPRSSPSFAAIEQRMGELRNENGNGTPSAPFIGKTEAWVSLALKRMIRYAVDNGFDRIAMVNGEQSAERYSLSKQVSRLDYEPSTQTLDAYGMDGKLTMSKDVTPEQLPDVIGKEAAERLLARPVNEGRKGTRQSLSGLDLQFGGEGMKAFYDRIVPQVTNDVLKKLGGGKVVAVSIRSHGKHKSQGVTFGDTTLDPNKTRIEKDNGVWRVVVDYGNGDERFHGTRFSTKREAQEYIDANTLSTYAQPGFDITDKMREHAAQGMPLFRRDEQQPAATNTHAADVIAKAAKTVNIPLDVYATPQEAAAKLGIDIPSDVRGLHYRGRAALISSNITTPAMGEFVLWHELLHAGITQVAPRYGNEYNRIMQDMAARNGNIVKAARDWRNSYGAETIKRSMEAGLSQEQAEKRMRLMAIEEAIADLAGANVELKGWTQFVAKLQALLRSMGFDNLANWIEGKSNAEVLQLIARTRDEVTTQNLHLTTQVPAFARDEDDASYQRAYHGTPHKFDKFSLDKIGTGEGAQAYGYGLYFASKREIAEHYRNTLASQRGFSYKGQSGLTRAEVQDLVNAEVGGKYLDGVARGSGVADTVIDDMMVGTLRKDGQLPKQYKAGSERAALYEKLKGEITHADPGALYQVDIPEDSEMLHWDKPLSEQPEAVKVALEKGNPALFQKNWYDAETKQPTELGETSGKMLNGVLSEVMDGSEYYRSLSSQTGGGAQASTKLRSLGIRGIKYLDGGSRNAGDGSYNYVVFDDNDVSIEAVHSRGTNDGMANDKTVVGNTTGRPADDVISGATAASQMLDAIERDPYADYAIRVIPGEFTGSVNVGDTLPVSNKWEDGTDTGKPLRGTSGIGIEQRSLKGVEQAIHRIGSSKTAGPNGFYFGNRVVLIKGESVASGEDVGESVIQNAEVVGVWTKPTKGKSEVQPNEQTTSQDGDVAFSRTGSGDIFDKNATAAQSTYNGTEAVQGMGMSVKNVMRQTANIARDKRGAALSFLGGRQIADIYSKDVPELPKYNEILQRMQAEQNEGSAVADSIIEKWRVINRKRPDVATQLSSLMHDSTLAQVDPDVSADNAELRKRWINLPQEAKDIYREARDAYVAHFEKVKAELIDRVERSALDTSAKNRTLASMREEFTKAMKGVYFPLARFGDYMVVVKDKAGVTQSVSMAETTNQAQALRAELLRAYPDYIVGAIQKKKEFNAERDGVSRGFMKDLVALISEEPDAQTRDSQLDAINQLWLSSLPDLSWAKSGIHRKGTPGYSNDAMRAFARNMFHGGYHLAKLRYGDRLGDTLAQMQETIDNKVRSNPEYSNVVAQSVVDEMNARHKHVMNPQNTPVANALTGLGFMWHMGLSPASAVVNLSQTALVAYPMLASKFGFGKAATMLLSLSADAVKGKNDLLSQLQGAEKDAYDRAVREGLIDITMAHDLAGVSQGKSGEFNEKQQRVMRVASVMFHEAEKFNRGVTFMSAYRLAVQSGVSDPYKLAHDLTFDSHFDYSSQNRPRVMQGPTARVVLLFKQYGQNMIYTLSRNTFKALQGDREAQKTLAGLLAMHGMFAGALGLPLMTTLLAAASAIGGSDDEPWDAQVALRNYLADAFGKDIGEVLAHGVFRAPGIKDAIGADISGRVGLDSMLIRMPQETLEGKKYYQALLETIAGPVFGIGGNIANGMQTMAQGNTLRGIEEMLPKSIKDPLKAYRYEQDGIQDKTGITIVDETTIPEEVAQFLGFSPARGMEGFEGKSAIKNQEALLTQRRRQLMQRYGKDAEEGDTADSLVAIQRWNIANPTMAIKGQDLLRSMREKAKRQAEAENGAYLSKKRRGLAELGEFANAE